MTRAKSLALDAMALDGAWYAADDEDITSWRDTGCPYHHYRGRRRLALAPTTLAVAQRDDGPTLEVTVHLRPHPPRER